MLYRDCRKYFARRFWADNRGVSAVEFAVTAPIIALFLAVLTDGGLAITEQMSLEGASRAGADYVAMNPTSWTLANVQQAANGATGLTATVSTRSYCGCAGASGIVQQSCTPVTACSNGNPPGAYVAVTATSNYTPLFTPLWGSLSQGVAGFGHTTVARTS